MTHHRKQIRDLIVAAVTGLATTGARVEQSRVYNVSDAEPNGILVYNGPNESRALSMGANPTIEQDFTVFVEPYAKASSDIDDVLDQICLEVEVAILGTDNDLTNTVHRINLVSTETEFSGDGDQPLGSAVMTFSVMYTTKETDPETIL